MDASFQHSPEFSKMLAGDVRPDLARIALEIASDFNQGLDLETYLNWIEAVARRIQERCPAGISQDRILNQIHWAMHVEEGFQGNRDDYYDVRNSYLNEVIDRKLGIPITLCVLFAAVASRVGLELSGVDLPAHFMLKIETPEGIRFIDPFNGVLLDQSGCENSLSRILNQSVRLTAQQLKACPPQRIVARILRNLKAVHLQEGEIPSALLIQRRLVAIFPDDPQELRDLGRFCIQLSRLDEGVTAFQKYLRLYPGSEDASEIELSVREACREIILRN